MEYQTQNSKFTFITKPSFSVFIKLKKCRGTLYKNLSDGKKKKIWSESLVNDQSPYGALIHNDGKFVVTFNDYAFLGYGENVVVIYDNLGELIKKLSLDDIIDFENQLNLKQSVSSIWWMGNHTIIESQNNLLLEIPFYSNFRQQEPDKFLYVLIDLNTGELIENFKSNNQLNEQQILNSENREEFLDPKKYDLISIDEILSNIEVVKVDTLLGIVHPIIDEDFRSYYDSPISIKTFYDISPEIALKICYFECLNYPEVSIKEASIIGSNVKDLRLSNELINCLINTTERVLKKNDIEKPKLYFKFRSEYSEMLNALSFQNPENLKEIFINIFEQFEGKAIETKENYRNPFTRLLATLFHGSPKEVDQYNFYKYMSYLLATHLSRIDSTYALKKTTIGNDIAPYIRCHSYLKESNKNYKIIKDSFVLTNETKTLTDIVTNPTLIEKVLNNLEIGKQSNTEISYSNLCNPIIIGEKTLAFSFFKENRYIAIMSLLDKKVKIKIIGPIDVIRDKY